MCTPKLPLAACLQRLLPKSHTNLPPEVLEVVMLAMFYSSKTSTTSSKQEWLQNFWLFICLPLVQQQLRPKELSFPLIKTSSKEGGSLFYQKLVFIAAHWQAVSICRFLLHIEQREAMTLQHAHCNLQCTHVLAIMLFNRRAFLWCFLDSDTHCTLRSIVE